MQHRFYGLGKKLYRDRYLILLFLPVLVYYLIFRMLPIVGGIVISVTEYSVFRGFAGSSFVGLEHYRQFFNSFFFWRLMRNTLAINIYQLVFLFPAPIILALLLNEVGRASFKRLVQTISYMPHFISSVVVVSMVVTFLSPSLGFVNTIIRRLGGESVHFLARPEYFWGILTTMHVWKGTGFGAIIYLAALTSIDPELYEASLIDGAGRFRQTMAITLPGIAPTVVIMLLIRLGNFLEVGYQDIILLYNPVLYETADVINTYVYRRGILESDYSFAGAIGMFQSVLGFLLLYVSNSVARRFGGTSMW